MVVFSCPLLRHSDSSLHCSYMLLYAFELGPRLLDCSGPFLEELARRASPHTQIRTDSQGQTVYDAPPDMLLFPR